MLARPCAHDSGTSVADMILRLARICFTGGQWVTWQECYPVTNEIRFCSVSHKLLWCIKTIGQRMLKIGPGTSSCFVLLTIASSHNLYISDSTHVTVLGKPEPRQRQIELECYPGCKWMYTRRSRYKTMCTRSFLKTDMRSGMGHLDGLEGTQ